MSGGAVIGPGSNAAVRIADVLLRNVGGRTVLLQMPAPAIPGDIGEQLGLATPQFQNIELGPVAFRRVRAKTGTANKPAEATYELLVSAVTVAKAAGALGMGAAESLFAQAAGVIVDDATLSITWVASAEAFGSVYLYRLGLGGAIKDFL